MKILSLKTHGFRKFADDFEVKFYEDVTYILGGNFKGKTNILFAITWGLLGCNLTGDEKVSLIHKDKADCMVELKITDNSNTEHIITRYKNKYDSAKNFLTLDGKIAKQEDLIKFYQNKNLFLSVFNLAYFVSLIPSKQKELIDKYLPDVDIKDVYNKLSDEEKQILTTTPTNAKLYIKELEDEIKVMKQKVINTRGKIDYAQNIA